MSIFVKWSYGYGKMVMEVFYENVIVCGVLILFWECISWLNVECYG